jgi:hypothetical protein
VNVGLYLCVFADDADEVEVDGVEVGPYRDFTRFREVVSGRLEDEWGSRFPVLMNHVDGDAVWSPAKAQRLLAELAEIDAGLRQFPAEDLTGWQADVARKIGHSPKNRSECFLDVDGELLVERLSGLARVSIARQRPVEFL